MSKATGRNDLQTGQAGEYLVCADLILMGYDAFLGTQGLPFDVIARVKNRLIKIQVKTTLRPRRLQNVYPLTYLFHVKRHGKGGVKRYPKGCVDIFALVSLDNREIGYITPDRVRQCASFRVPGVEYATPATRGYYLRDYTFKQALIDIGVK